MKNSMALDLKKLETNNLELRYRKGIYQWLVDHSTVLDDGRLKIIAYIDGENDLWERIMYRVRGEYARYKKIEEERKKKQLTYIIGQEKGRRKNKKMIEIEKRGTLIEKFVLWIYKKSSNYLF